MATTSAFAVQPQRVAIGSFQGSDGRDVPVYCSQPWYRAFQQLAGVGPSPSPSPGGVSIDATPAFEFGALVYRSGAATLRGLPAGTAGQALLSQGDGTPPTWSNLPAPPAGATPRQISAYGALRAF